MMSASITRAAETIELWAERLATMRGAAARPVGRCAPPDVTGGDEAAQVARGAAGDEDPTGPRRQPREVGQPAEGLVLGEDRPGTLEPRPAVDRRGPHDEVEQDGGLGGRHRHEGQVRGMVDRDARRRQDISEHPEGLEPADPGIGDGVPGHGPQLGLGPRPVEGRRVHADPLHRVAQDRPG